MAARVILSPLKQGSRTPAEFRAAVRMVSTGATFSTHAKEGVAVGSGKARAASALGIKAPVKKATSTKKVAPTVAIKTKPSAKARSVGKKAAAKKSAHKA
jgi:hypothetical protein